MHLAKSPACKPFYEASRTQKKVEPELKKDITFNIATAETCFRNTLRHQMFEGLAEMYWFRYFTESQIQHVRDCTDRGIETALLHTATEIQRGTASAGEAEDLSNLLRGRLNIYDGLATEAQVRAYADAHLPPMRPFTYPVGPRPTDRAGGIMIVDWLVHLIQSNDVARAHIMAASDRLKSGSCLIPPDTYRDMFDGSAVREHVFAQPHIDNENAELKEVRVLIILGYDDLEPLNALGAKRVWHKVGGFYGAIANLPAELRFEHEMMALLLAVEEAVLTRCDPVRVVAGADPVTGAFIKGDRQTLGAQFRALFDGVEVLVCEFMFMFACMPRVSQLSVYLPCITAEHLYRYVPCNTAEYTACFWQVPLGSDSTLRERVLLRVGMIEVSADFLGKTKLLPCYQSPAAHRPCTTCNYNTTVKGAKKAYSWFHPEKNVVKRTWKLRTKAHANRALCAAFKLPVTKRIKHLTKNGLKSKNVRGVG